MTRIPELGTETKFHANIFPGRYEKGVPWRSEALVTASGSSPTACEAIASHRSLCGNMRGHF
jgi:hypothetical protein